MTRAGRLLRAALDDAGVELDASGRRVACWLARQDPATVEVVAGWVTTAAEARALVLADGIEWIPGDGSGP